MAGRPALSLSTDRDVETITAACVAPHAMPLSSVHPMGTMRLGDDARRSAVRSTGEHHFVKGLFVLDGSLFPTSIGVPPQISIYSFSKHLSRHAIERARQA